MSKTNTLPLLDIKMIFGTGIPLKDIPQLPDSVLELVTHFEASFAEIEMKAGFSVLQAKAMGKAPSPEEEEEVTTTTTTSVPLYPVIQEMQDLIENDADLYQNFIKMFQELPRSRYPPSLDYKMLMVMFNSFLTQAPSFEQVGKAEPLMVLLSFLMATPSGNIAFLNERYNIALKNLLMTWSQFLCSPASRYVINPSPTGWQCEEAQKLLKIQEFQYQPDAPYWGFTSWNDFFTRKFKSGQRPVASPDSSKIISNPCESTPYRIATGSKVNEMAQFWIKDQPYSLHHMLNGNHVDRFVGGTVFQAFLSPFNYHRYHAPVSGTIKQAFVQPGSYFATCPHAGVDPYPISLSQGYLAQVAARAIYFIEADDKDIGLVCFTSIGMTLVSSTLITVQIGQKVTKGQELGYFQFGGSTFCLLFGPHLNVTFPPNVIPNPTNPQLVLVNAKLASVTVKTI